MIFTVIGYYESSGQICADHVEAKDGAEAMRLAAQARKDGEGGDTGADDYMLVVAIPGKHVEEESDPLGGLTFAGDSPVDANTYLGMEK